MKASNYEVTSDAVAPARPDGTCYYCRAAIGTEHNEGCVMRLRTVVVEATFRFIRQVPEDWDRELIEEHRNLSGHADDPTDDGCATCAYNTVTTLLGPMLLRSLFFVREATAEDEEKLIAQGENQSGALLEDHQ